MTHLAKEFGLSDVVLHKICKKHDVPNPPLGWWARKGAGQKVKPTPLPRAGKGVSEQIAIAGGETRAEPETIAVARERARVLASSIPVNAALSHPAIARTVERLRRARPSPLNGLVAVEGKNVIKATLASSSIDRFELALNRVVAAAEAVGMKLVAGEGSAAFWCDGETIGFGVVETVRREKHVLTENEIAEDEAERRRREGRRGGNPWDDDFSFHLSRMNRPEWDYHPTGLLGLELEHFYLLDGGPRRSFRDAKVQRLENLAGDIVVGIVVLAAARAQDRLKREERARQAEAERLERDRARRAQHINKRRVEALDQILEELAALDRLRRLVVGLRDQIFGEGQPRVSALLALAEARLAEREMSLSAAGLEERLAGARLFGDDDDHDFRASLY